MTFIEEFKSKQTVDSKQLKRRNDLLERQNCQNFQAVADQTILLSKGKLIYEALIDAVKVSHANVNCSSALVQSKELEAKLQERKEKQTFRRLVDTLQGSLKVLQARAAEQADMIRGLQSNTEEFEKTFEESQT